MAGFLSEDEVAKYLDDKFGKGKWRFTSGYRSQGSEDRLRGEGAGTVPEGKISAHSKGTYEAPGAEDIVVDGKSADEVKGALKDGPFTKVIAEGREGPEGPHIHVEPAPPLPAGYALVDDPAVSTPAATPALPAGYTLVPDAPPPAARTSPLAAARAAEGMKEMTAPPSIGAQVASVPGRVASEFGGDVMARVRPAAAQLASDFAPPPPPNSLQDAVMQGVRQAAPLGAVGMDVLSYATAPIQGAVDYLIGRPVEQATGGAVNRQTAGNYASLLIPAGGEVAGAAELAAKAREAGVSVDAMRGIEAQRAENVRLAPKNALAATVKGDVTPAEAGSDATSEHAAAVARLKAEGVRPAAHQEAGGVVQRVAESAKANPYTGPGIRASEQAATDSFNRALYGKILRPLGIGVKDTIPVGRDGVAMVEKKLGEAYDEVLPHVRLLADNQLTDQLADIRTSVAKLGKPQEQQYEAILNQDVLHHFGKDGMDGRTFKSVESDLLRQSRDLKGSPDPNARGLGRALEDTLDALRQDMIDHSPAEYRARLKGINQGYAMFTRLQDAAARRQAGGGTVTPGDLLAAVKKGDRSVRKGAFARGDALLQDFAEDADRVLSPRHGTSHTPEIQETNKMLGARGVVASTLGAGIGASVGGEVGAGLGAAMGIPADMVLARGTNALARRLLERGAPEPKGAPRNYLGAAQRRAVSGATPVAAISNQAQQ